MTVSPVSESASIKVRQGETFSIELTSNRTTGFSWALAVPLDSSMLELVSTQYISQQSNQDGSEGREIWQFKARRRGAARIILHYQRQWSGEILPGSIREYVISSE